MKEHQIYAETRQSAALSSTFAFSYNFLFALFVWDLQMLQASLILSNTNNCERPHMYMCYKDCVNLITVYISDWFNLHRIKRYNKYNAEVKNKFANSKKSVKLTPIALPESHPVWWVQDEGKINLSLGKKFIININKASVRVFKSLYVYDLVYQSFVDLIWPSLYKVSTFGYWVVGINCQKGKRSCKFRC